MDTNRNLRVVNGFSKAARIVSMILFVLLTVCAALTLLTLIACFVIPVDRVLENATDLSPAAINVISSMPGFLKICLAICIVLLVVYAISLKLSANYYKRELRDGTPFTEGGAKQLRTLGIVKMAIEVALAVAGNVLAPLVTKPLEKLMPDLLAVMEEYGGTTVDLESALNALHERSFNFRLGTGFWLGLAFVALSFLLMYGAELAKRAGETERQTAVQPREDVWVPVEPHTEG